MSEMKTLNGYSLADMTAREDIGKKVDKGSANPPPMLTIIDDDGHVKFYNHLLPVIKEKNVPIASAVVASLIGISANYMTLAQITECAEQGAEILCHGFNHNTTEEMAPLAVDVIQRSFQRGKNHLTTKGFPGGRFMVYNGGSGDLENVRLAASRVFDCAVLPTGSVMNYTDSVDRWGIKRYPIELASLTNVENMYALIDECLANGGWMIWMVHTSDALGADTIDNFRLAIDYAKSKNLEIVTFETGYNYYVDRFTAR